MREDLIEQTIAQMRADDPDLDADTLRRALGASVHAALPVRVRGRPAGVKPVRVHLLIPPDLLARFDAKRGDVPRLTMIRRLMAEYIQKQEGEQVR